MANYVTNTSDKKKKTAMICCLLGLIGVGGIHRFYVGKIVTGIIYFCTFGLLFIGTIIDLLMIATGSFRDNVGAPLRE